MRFEGATDMRTTFLAAVFVVLAPGLGFGQQVVGKTQTKETAQARPADSGPEAEAKEEAPTTKKSISTKAKRPARKTQTKPAREDGRTASRTAPRNSSTARAAN